MNRKLTAAITIALVLCAVSLASAGEPMEAKNNPVQFKGKLWSRYSYVLEDLSPGDGSKDHNAFAIDRVYATFTSALGERYSGRVRFEIKNLNDGSADIFIKLADVQVKEPFGVENTKVRIGQTGDLISSWLEKPWGYRIVSKSTTDRYLGISTAYQGAGFSGKWLDGILETDLLVANRVSHSKDISSGGDPKYKTLGARAFVQPITEGSAKGLGFGGYAQYSPVMSPSGDNNNTWFGAHAYFRGTMDDRPFTLGGQFDSRIMTRGGNDVTAAVLSGFGRVNVTEKVELFGRLDIVDFNTDEDDAFSTSSAAQTVLIAGVSNAYSKTLRSIIDVSVRSIGDDVFEAVDDHLVKLDSDTEIVINARIDAVL